MTDYNQVISDLWGKLPAVQSPQASAVPTEQLRLQNAKRQLLIAQQNQQQTQDAINRQAAADAKGAPGLKAAVANGKPGDMFTSNGTPVGPGFNGLSDPIGKNGPEVATTFTPANNQSIHADSDYFRQHGYPGMPDLPFVGQNPDEFWKRQVATDRFFNIQRKPGEAFVAPDGSIGHYTPDQLSSLYGTPAAVNAPPPQTAAPIAQAPNQEDANGLAAYSALNP